MVQLAEALTQQVSHADWAMFCKNGSDATSMAMVISRAYREKRKILVARGTYHGASPWNVPYTTGITKEDRAHVVYFEYNDIESLNAAVKSVDGDVAAIYATPFRHEVLYDQFSRRSSTRRNAVASRTSRRRFWSSTRSARAAPVA